MGEQPYVDGCYPPPRGCLFRVDSESESDGEDEEPAQEIVEPQDTGDK